MEQKTKATLKEITLDKQSRQIIITINAKDSMFVEEPKDGMGFPMFISGACLVDGVKEILKHGHLATQALTSPGEYRSLTAEIDRLNGLIMAITSFEEGERVKIDGLTFQKAINVDTFYKTVQSQLDTPKEH